ncbi:MATH domain and coiled-coil domain-containing protein At3g58250-like [Hevea brasiliensis]|uniref:MATH domain and coiled-coil domain-containing protein At3g58250-like n=1 Tax=Hevea brasiliensis TaxID=3981 RepID=UPI0025E356A4|nr:MATH domain and coiled-coil domain-containing protein At3g58250-like [Hevea brasiliensis]
MEDRTLHPDPSSHSVRVLEISRSKRDAPPAHYTLKIESFSQLCRILRDNDLEKYESDDFEAGGYKWKMVLYPHGNWNRGANGHISLYLAIAEAKAIPPGSQVDVTLKFFVYDHIRDTYLTIQDDEMRRYHYLKTENGFDQLISLKMKIERFSKLQKGRNFSKEFSVAKHNWRLMLYPKGDPMAGGNSLSLFLQLLNNSAHILN